MSSSAIQSPFPAVILGHFLRQIQEHHFLTPTRAPIPLHYNPSTKSLTEFFWPRDSESGAQVTPDMLETFRRTHKFRGPCCLCPLLDKSIRYMEAVIGFVDIARRDPYGNSSTFEGEFVAVCARHRCGYSLRLELFFPYRGLKFQACPKREVPLPVQASVQVSEDLGPTATRHEGLSQILEGSVSRIRGERNRLPHMSPEVSYNARNKFIDNLYNGVSEAEFWRTFAQCTECKAVLIVQGMFTFASHRCRNSSITDANVRKTLRYHPHAQSTEGASTSAEKDEGEAEDDDGTESECDDGEDEDDEEEEEEDIDADEFISDLEL
ncbi:hypothetical protein NMY22_g804 [Coprinellus aureogranulatus]|nr:hypothetical protein NMY22_g804 [Coprinellus aureogranulatus]